MTTFRRNVLLVLIVLCAAVLVGWHFSQQHDRTPQNQRAESLRVSGQELTTMRDQWVSVITQIGPDAAYAQFLEEAPQNTLVGLHTQAHVFGEALYAAEGISGIKACDSSFEFGCYHSFFGSAVRDQGIGVLPQFDQACKDAYGSFNLPCQHGIGHGVLVYTDYDALEDALALCETISWQPTGGCSSGVFMEYNFHTMGTSEQGEYLRPLGDDPYEPCNAIEEKYKQSCYFEQIQWWETVFNKDYKKLGKLCAEAPEDEHVIRSCFHGIGNYAAAHAKLAIEDITALCVLMPSDEEMAWCHEGASWLVRGDGSGREAAQELCSVILDGELRAACLSKL